MSSEAVAEDRLAFFEGEMIELPLCLPCWQAAALEQAAHNRGVTAGQMLRGIVEEFFSRFARP